MINIYEVMALEQSYPLFFFEHIKRLKNSIDNFKRYDLEELTAIIVKLIKPELERDLTQNIKITYNVESDSFLVERTESTKPSKIIYDSGAVIGILKAERDNPLVKKENLDQRKISSEICLENGYFELLLENRYGELTEGSKSNFLCIDKCGSIITSPIGDSLNGITRQIVFDICKSKNIPIIEQKINFDTLTKVDSLIITGTSPGILPVKNCGTVTFLVKNRIIDILQKEYTSWKIEDLKITKKYF